MQSLASREQNQKNAAYNLGVAEAIRIHKNEKPEFHVRVFSKFLGLIPALLVSIWIHSPHCTNFLKMIEVKRGLCKAEASFQGRSGPGSASTSFTFIIQFLLVMRAFVNDSNFQPGPGRGGDRDSILNSCPRIR